VGSRRLTLLRHGQAQPADAAALDFERPLTQQGRLEARDMAERLLRRGLVPELILTSPAERALGSAQILAQTCGTGAAQVRCVSELYLATPQAVWRLLADQDDSTRHILICGHNPGLSELASRLGPAPSQRVLATCGLATAAWHEPCWQTLEPWTAVSCELDQPDRLPVRC